MEDGKQIAKQSDAEVNDSTVLKRSSRGRRILHNTQSILLAPWKDEYMDMTMGRRFARKLIEKYDWYFPSKVDREKYEENYQHRSNDEEEDISQFRFIPPSLDNAWAFFEHFVLPRYYIEEKREGFNDNPERKRSKFALLKYATQKSIMSGLGFGRFRDEFVRSDPGVVDRPTKLYPIWETSTNDLGDFGTGVGLYFYTLKSIAFILFFAGVLNITNMVYFSSAHYGSDSQHNISHSYLKGSAVCTDTSWKACPDCRKSDWDYVFWSGYDRYAETSSTPPLKFVLRNNCEIDRTFAIISITTVCFIFVAILVLNFILREKIVKIDESSQTTTDYSIVVKNPPADACDAEEWKLFFENLDDDIHVTVCTVALNNEKLLEPLIQRRKLLLQIQNQLPDYVPFDDRNIESLIKSCNPPTFIQRYFFFMKPAEAIYEEIKKIESRVAELSKKKYDCTNVFITFETEQAQRHVLKTMTTSIRHANLQTIPSDFPPEYLFRGKYLLRIKEPDEPSTTRWMDLNETDLTCLLQRTLTFFITVGLLLGCAFLIYLARKRSAFTASITITCFNQIIPFIVKYLNSLETHYTQSSYEGSQYIKITVFRCVNTAIITSVITPFTDTLQDEASLLNSIFFIFLTEMIVIPVLQLSNVVSNFKMYVLGPRAIDQRRMNLLFRGAYYEIGERYTAMTKVLFFTLFYCTLFPLGFFFASVILAVTYWVDKYSLLRTWRAAPQIGHEVSDYTRKIFLPLSILVYAIIGSHQYASFPFDNICVTNQTVTEDYTQKFEATTLEGQKVLIDIKPGDSAYKHCLQDMFRWTPMKFPATGSTQADEDRWMSATQEDNATLYGWISVGFLCVVGWAIFSSVLLSLRKYFCKLYKPRGDPSGFEYSKVDGIDGYVPQMQLKGYAFPTLLCNVENVSSDMIGWSDPCNAYDRHNIIYDFIKIFVNKDESMRSSHETQVKENISRFSTVKHWPH